MRNRQTKSAPAHRAAACLLAFTSGLACQGATLDVAAFDRDGAPVPGVAVYAVPEDEAPPIADPPPHAVMDQVDLEFVPHVLVVQAGTVVDFPNSDHVNHHVYSFSEAKSFELPLYKGRVYPPVTFDEAGLVTLGCNIHDNMLGYILVTETPWFTTTDGTGQARLDALPAGRYRVHAWTPRSDERNLPAAQDVVVGGADDATLSFRFTQELFPPHGQDGSLSWSAY